MFFIITSSKDLKKAMYNILVDFQNSSNINDFLSNHDDIDFEIALEECISNNLLVGLTMQRASDNNIMFSLMKPRISMTGLEFIENFKE